MELELKGIRKKDKEAIRFLNKERKKIINDSSSQPIETDFVGNALSNSFHPFLQQVKVADIIVENYNTKTFVLVPNKEAGTKRLAYFRPGQYISIEVPIGKGIYKRPYTISCSPKMALDNTYTITIKRRINGVVSNYFLDCVQIGETFLISAPNGEFYYEKLRDAKNVIALAGGSGITPFLSMAEAIRDGILDIKLTIFYGAKKEKDLVFRNRLDELAKKSNLIEVIYILSDEQINSTKTGFITKEIIDPYLQNETSFFVCGPLGFYESMNQVLKEYHLPNKYIRHDAFFGKIDLEENEIYHLKVITQNREFMISCSSRETLLCAMEKNGVVAPSKCHVGECGFCKSKLKSGKVKTFDENIRAADKENRYIHPCATFPESDVVIELPR